MVFSFNFKLNVTFNGKTWNILKNLKLIFRFVLQVEKTFGVRSFQQKLPLLIMHQNDWIMIALCTNIFLARHISSQDSRGLGL